MIQCNQFSDTVQPPPSRWVGNRITFSDLTHCEIAAYEATTYSIKYVVSGTEHYFSNNKRYPVSAGHFLLVNKHQPVDILIRSRKKVTGFCLHFEDDLLRDVYSQLILPEQQRLDDPFHKTAVPEFEQIIYSEKENRLGNLLENLSRKYNRSTGMVAQEQESFFQKFSHELLLMQPDPSTGIKNICAEKNSTKKELIRRLEVAKEIMHNADPLSFNIDDIAQHAMLSSSHFFRSFKKLYGITPYQYLLQQKIERSAVLLRKKQCSVTDVALSSGFADVACFSKAFRKHY